METKNAIINNYISALTDTGEILAKNGNSLTSDNMDENTATLRTLNVLLETIRAQLVNIQNAIDTYGG